MALREALKGLKVMQLHQRACKDGSGIESYLVDDAMDSDDPKTTLIELIVGQMKAAQDLQVRELEQRRAELQKMRVMALQQRALDDGVESSLLADAMDSDNPKAALIALIMAVPLTPSEGIPPESEKVD